MACGSEPSCEISQDADPIASFSGWILTRTEWQAEFVRARGDSALAGSQGSDRIAFAELLLQKELLLTLARERCAEADRKRVRLDRVIYEKNALRRLVEWQSQRVPHNPAYFESLGTAAGLTFHRGTFPLIQERFATFWDSVNAGRRAGAAFDVQEIEAPRWIFTETENSQPLYELWGRTRTVADFVRSLDDIDVDHWPTRGDSAKVHTQIAQRIHRQLYLQESERNGVLTDTRFEEKMERVRERHLLDQFRDRVVRVEAQLAETDFRAYFDQHREFYQSQMQTAAGGAGRDGSGSESLPKAEEESDELIFLRVRPRVERDALEEWTNREIDRLIAEKKQELGGRVYTDALR